LKPDCHDCPAAIRGRCIQECSTSSGVKLIMMQVFEAGRDSQQIWERLQVNCLLLRQGEQVPRVPPCYCLALQDGQHRIAVPADGEIVLGRFDPMTNVTPDVDLSYDDREHRLISRRHARIAGHDGQHAIEDLGSTNGTRVNGKRLRLGQQAELWPGDRVTLGHCTFVYAPLPRVSPHGALSQAYLWVTFTGHRFSLFSQGEGIIGRSDHVVGFVPDIDLSREEYAAQVVARRHVKIIVRDGCHYVEDLGSASGTRLNGVRIKIGECGLLNPGDHLWLGGCVLAYDVEV